MDTWPDIKAPSRITGGISDPLDEATFETGDDAARARFSAPRQQPLTISWPWLSYADYSALEAFQNVQRSSLFIWVHPRTGVAWEARFTSDPFKFEEKAESTGLSVTCTILPVRKVS